MAKGAADFYLNLRLFGRLFCGRWGRWFFNEPDLPGSDLPEGGDYFTIPAVDERVDPLVELPRAFCRDVDEGKTVFAIFEAVFYGNSGHFERL